MQDAYVVYCNAIHQIAELYQETEKLRARWRRAYRQRETLVNCLYRIEMDNPQLSEEIDQAIGDMYAME